MHFCPKFKRRSRTIPCCVQNRDAGLVLKRGKFIKEFEIPPTLPGFYKRVWLLAMNTEYRMASKITDLVLQALLDAKLRELAELRAFNHAKDRSEPQRIPPRVWARVAGMAYLPHRKTLTLI